MRWLKTAGGLLAIMVLMVLMVSCIRIDAKIKIEDDGSGTVEYLTALNADSLTSVLGDFDIPESEIGDIGDLCQQFETDFSATSQLPDGATTTPYNEDGFCGTVIEYDFGPSTDASIQIQSILEDPSARLYKEGENWIFEVTIDTEELTAEAADAPVEMLDALFGDASYTITVDLPGRAVDGENNATSIGDDGEFTWNIDILDPPAQLFAQTEPGSGGGTGGGSGDGGGGGGIGALLIGLVLLGLAALIGFLLWKRKNGTGETPDAGLHQPGIYQNDATMMPPGTATMPPGTASMPLADGPVITAAPPPGTVTPVAGAMNETVVMSAADVEQSIQDHVTNTTAAASTEAVFDEALNAWVIDDPARGRLRHDTATDTWLAI